MLDIFLKFFGISEYVIDSEVVSAVLPVLICVAAALTLYILIVFFSSSLRFWERSKGGLLWIQLVFFLI